MTLTPHQQEKADEVIGLFRSGEKRVVLAGSAGVGKTTVSAYIAEVAKRDRTINNSYNNGHVYVTAPTNKALSVLQSKIKEDVLFKTIHSACKLKHWVDNKTGQAIFKRDTWYTKRKGDEFDRCRLAEIDEVSMLNSDFLGRWIVNEEKEKEYIRGYLEDFSIPILFLGDDKQLNPIGEEISPIWIKGYPTVILTEIIRQGEGNPIIDLSRDLDLIYFKRPRLIDSKGYIYSEDTKSFIDRLAEVNGTDELKYLAYTNAKGPGNVESMNKVVRERRYGANPARIEKGETIVFNTPMGNFFTNQEVKVEEMKIIADRVAIPTEKTTFDESANPMNGELDYIKMKYYRVNGAFNVVHEDSDNIYKVIYSTLKENNKRLGWSGRGYHFFEQQFADITYNHALTIHKSQGSTYKETIMNIGNIDINRNMAERERLLYTGVTRASNLITLTNVR